MIGCFGMSPNPHILIHFIGDSSLNWRCSRRRVGRRLPPSSGILGCDENAEVSFLAAKTIPRTGRYWVQPTVSIPAFRGERSDRESTEHYPSGLASAWNQHKVCCLQFIREGNVGFDLNICVCRIRFDRFLVAPRVTR